MGIWTTPCARFDAVQIVALLHLHFAAFNFQFSICSFSHCCSFARFGLLLKTPPGFIPFKSAPPSKPRRLKSLYSGKPTTRMACKAGAFIAKPKTQRLGIF